MTDIKRPDLSKRPYQMEFVKLMKASPHKLYMAWTKHFDVWFAAPGSVIMDGKVNTLYYFETEHEGKRHPHYGRFIQLEPDKLVEMTWVNEEGTKGAETIVKVEFIPTGSGTNLKLNHMGFPDEKSKERHKEAWPQVLENLDTMMLGF